MDRSRTKLDYSILAAFVPGAARPRSSAFYHLSLLLAAVVMMLLPLGYAAFVAGIAYLVYLHAVYDWAPTNRIGRRPANCRTT